MSWQIELFAKVWLINPVTTENLETLNLQYVQHIDCIVIWEPV